LNSALVEPLIGESRKLLLIQNYMNAFRDLEFDDTSNSKLIYSLQFKRYAINHARLELFKNKEQLRGRSLYYQLKKDYQGTLRECVISYVISTNRTAYIPDTSYKSDALSFFKDKRFIKIIRKFYPDNSNYSIFNEPLINKEGKLITLSEFKGKIILIDFWFTGCTGCKQMKPYLDKIDSTFKENNNVVLISISVDQNNDTWLKSVNKKIYSSTNAEPFRVDADHPSIIKRFNVASYPQMLLVAKSGSVTVPEDPRNDNSKKLIEKIYGMDAR
jgi:thiol-disulfide isomerase/thioredoxin